MASDFLRSHGPIEQPWYSYLSIDLLFRVAQRSFLHWFIAWIIPLSFIALGRDSQDLLVITSSIYAATVSLIWLFLAVDDRVAFGPARQVNLDEEVVVITGGANGLGLIMAQMLGMQGANVAVLDIETPEVQEVRGVTFYKCDVGYRDQVQNAARKIKEELGTATILINNAGVVNPKSILDISPEEIDHTYRVNTLAHFYAIRAFVPGMLTAGHGTVVTVSSVMGKLGCAKLPYTSTKAALLSLHTSLRADLAHLARSNPAASNIKTVLVTPGQLNTRMFASVRTPSAFFAPVVEPVEIAREIVRLVLSGRSGEVSMPLYTRLIGWLNVVPPGVRETLRWIAGMDQAMIDAVKRDEQRTKGR